LKNILHTTDGVVLVVVILYCPGHEGAMAKVVYKRKKDIVEKMPPHPPQVELITRENMFGRSTARRGTRSY
jgi:hypothetical protein